MPSFPPRKELIKKKDQLTQREQELTIALIKGYSQDKLIKRIEMYRHATLSLLKARIHQIREMEFQKKPFTVTIEKIEAEAMVWTNKTNEEILREIKIKAGLIST